MIELSNPTIQKCCRLINNYFPSIFIINIFKDITEDDSLANFSAIRDSERIVSLKPIKKLSLKSIEEMKNYFLDKQYQGDNNGDFFNFLKQISTQSIENEMLKNKLDEFISEINPILFENDLKIENYQILKKWIPKLSKNDFSDVSNVYLDINVPKHIIEYFSEALSCYSHELHRSCILFCIIALEASLRYNYHLVHGNTKIKPKSKIIKCPQNVICTKKRSKSEITFERLIEEAVNNDVIVFNYPEEDNLKFIRKYRNDLAHYDFTKPNNLQKINAEYAKTQSIIIIHQVKGFINQIFD